MAFMTPHFFKDFQHSFERHTKRPALDYRGRLWSYAELGAAAQRCAAWLQSMGLTTQDRVALFTADKLPFLIGHLGVLFAGGIPLPLNPRFTREEMRYFLSDSGARLVIAGQEQAPLLAELAAGQAQPPTVVLDFDV